MQNLAGHHRSTEICTDELERCGIDVIRSTEPLGEPRSMIYGQLGPYKFVRAWYYWMVTGNVPLNVAQELYNNRVGKTDIRVDGHCSCPPPEEWVKWINDDGMMVLSLKEQKEMEEYGNGDSMLSEISKQILQEYKFSDNPESIGAKPYIENYHIDSELGLYIFVQTLRKYGLV